MDIINVMDRLEALVNTSSKVPATRSKLVDEEKISELLEQMRLAIPQDMRAAQEVIERKDAILNQAQVDARRVRREAEDEFATRLDQNELMAAARKRAEELDQDIRAQGDPPHGAGRERVQEQSCRCRCLRCPDPAQAGERDDLGYGQRPQGPRCSEPRSPSLESYLLR